MVESDAQMDEAASRGSGPVLLSNVRWFVDPTARVKSTTFIGSTEVSGSSPAEPHVEAEDEEGGQGEEPPLCKDPSQVGWLSFFTVSWIWPMLKAGKQRQVSLDDAPRLAPREDTMLVTHRLLKKLGEVERTGLSHPLLRAMVLTFWPEYLAKKLIGVSEIFLRLAEPMLLQQVLIWQEAQNDGVELDAAATRHGMVAVALLILLGLFKIFFGSQKDIYMHRVGIRFGSALRGAVLARCVQGTPSNPVSSTGGATEGSKTKSKRSKGKDEVSPAVYNLISHDIGPNVAIIDVVIGLWSFPLGFSAAVVLLYQQVHDAVLPGLFVGLSIKLIIFALLGKDGFLRHRLMKAKDVRLSACAESFNGIRVLQMLAWTKPFYDRIMTSRAVELHAQHMRLWCGHIKGAIEYSSGELTNLATLAYFVMHYDGAIKASTWVPVTALIGHMVGPFGNFPNWLHSYLIWRDAYSRVNAYMGYEPYPPVIGRSCFPFVFLLLLIFCGVMTGLARILGFVEVGIVWSGVWSIIWCFVGLGLVLLLSGGVAAAYAAVTEKADERADSNAGDLTAVAEMQDCTLVPGVNAAAAAAAAAASPNRGEESAVATAFALHGVNLRVGPGKLTVLVGAEGQGKTSLLAALLGEIPVASGRIMSPAISRRAAELANSSTSSQLLPKTTAGVRKALAAGSLDGPSARVADSQACPYAAQDTMVFTGTIRENVLFGSTFDPKIYGQVLQACALECDLAVMPAGDLTEVAQGGVTLSGGQRARVGLARAAYRGALALSRQRPGDSAPLVLLDDPLSSLDKKVAQHVLKSLFARPGGLLGPCAVVLATADPWWLSFLRDDVGRDFQVAQIQDGHVLSDEKDGVAGCLRRDSSTGASSPSSSSYSAEAERVKAKGSKEANYCNLNVQGTDRLDVVQEAENENMDDEQRNTENMRGSEGSNKQVAKVIQEEHREAGHVRWRTYMYYVRSIGPVTLTILLFALFNIMVWQMACSLWIVYWTDVDKPGKMHSLVRIFTDTPPHTKHDLLLVYGILAALFTASNFAGHGLEVIGGVKASRKIFRDALKGALSMPLRWWDENPTGRALNRFSEDVETMDNAITFIIGIIFGAVLYFVYHVVMLAIANPVSLAFLPFVAVGMEYYARFYRRTIREVQRIWLTCMSVVYQDMVEAVVGRTTVCAFANAQQVLCKSMEGLDRLQRITFAKDTISLWLGLRMGLIGYSMAVYAKLYPVLQYYGVFSPQSAALVGFAIKYSQDTVGIISQFIGNFSDLEMQLIAIERLRDYAEAPRADFSAPGVLPDLPAPVEGSRPRLQLSDVSVTYREGLSPALSGVTLQFAAQEATAIVGRTGAGKTSLFLAVLQLVPYEGCVEVDGLPLSSISPELVRRRLVGAVPQQPLLFTGDLRWNLDPEGQWKDDELWAALEAVGLKSVCDQDARGLEVPLVGREEKSNSGGSSGLTVALSQGQRQLLCAARVLLRKQRVVMLDEVTSTLPQEAAVSTVRDMVDRFKAADAAVLLVTHQEEVTCCCERVVTVAGGRVISDERREPAEDSDSGPIFTV